MKTKTQNHSTWTKVLGNLQGRFITQKWFDVGLRGKMSAIVLVGLIGLISIFTFIAVTTVRQTTQQFLSEHVLRARVLAENLDLTLGQMSGLLTILASEIDMESPQAGLDEWKGILEQDFQSTQGIYLFNERSELIAATGTPPAIDWKNVPSLRVSSGTPLRAISTDGIPRPYALIVVPVPSKVSQTPAGMLAAVLDLSNYATFLLSGSIYSDHIGTLQILDGNGKVLSSTSLEQGLTPDMIEKIVTNLFVEGQPMVEACLGCLGEELEDTGTVIAFAPLSQAPWGVVIWHDTDVLFAPVRQLAIQTLILGALAIGGALVLVLVTTRSVIAPVQALTEATQTISGLQFDPSSVERIECNLANSLAGKNNRRDEIGLLSKSFSTMCTNLQLSIKEIKTLNRELDERVQSRTQQLSILNTVAVTVNQSLNLKDILNRAIDEVLQLTGIDVVAIFLQDSSRGQLKLSASRGLSENAARLAYQIGLLDSDCGGVMELGKAVVVPDLSPYRGRGAESLRKENVTALMHVPLMTKGCALGSMCVGTRANLEFDSEEQRLLTAIGNQIAIAVENARLYSEVQRKERLRGELFTKALAAQEDERKRIARELHDEVSQSLTALLYEAEDGLEMEIDSSITQQRLQSICDLTKHTLNNIHKLIFDLRPSMLDQLGLIPALRWLAETRLESRGVRVTVNDGSSPDQLAEETDTPRLSSEIETTLYRVIQEAINNIARHAAARNVEINLDFDAETVRVGIKDDGLGFDLSELNASANKELEDVEDVPNNTRGLGIMGMQERIELLGGELEILTAPGSGTQIHILVPLGERSLIYD